MPLLIDDPMFDGFVNSRTFISANVSIQRTAVLQGTYADMVHTHDMGTSRNIAFFMLTL
jgi:hypothetical protein